MLSKRRISNICSQCVCLSCYIFILSSKYRNKGLNFSCLDWIWKTIRNYREFPETDEIRLARFPGNLLSWRHRGRSSPWQRKEGIKELRLQKVVRTSFCLHWKIIFIFLEENQAKHHVSGIYYTTFFSFLFFFLISMKRFRLRFWISLTSFFIVWN